MILKYIKIEIIIIYGHLITIIKNSYLQKKK